MSSIAYTRGLDWLAKNDWTGAAVIRGLLTTSSYTPDVDHDFVSDVTNELTNTNYVRRTASNKTLTIDDTNNLVKIDADDLAAISALAAGGTPKYLVLYVQIGGDDTTPGDDVLLFSLDLGAAPAPNGGEYSTPFNAAGVATLASA
jgi:hypothetical protein